MIGKYQERKGDKGHKGNNVVAVAAGLGIMIVSEAATLAKIEPFWSWNTPICWTGFILFADSIVYRARHDSWIHSAPREFAALTLVSIPLWLVFEFYNLYIDNWYYTGLPEKLPLRLFGYAWSFATITPAIFEGADLISVIRGWRSRHATVSRGERRARLGGDALWIATGAVMLAVPFVTTPSVARYLAAPVWLGFIFLLDPINARLGAQTLTRDRIVNLSFSGLLCGVLWEFWNFWSRAKWHYSVPIMERLKIFEMPVLGYFGFPTFALECFTMYVFVRALFLLLTGGAETATARAIAL